MGSPTSQTQAEQNSPFQSKKFNQTAVNSSPLSQNLSASSSSNSSSFRTWNNNNKTKESNQPNNINEFDNISDLSTDNDPAYAINDSNTNVDTHSLRNCPTSNDNIHLKSQQYVGKEASSPKDTNSNNIFNNNAGANGTSKNQPESATNHNFAKTPSNSNLLTNNLTNFSDEEPASPNMNSYNYYSNMINNLKTSSSSNLNQEANSNLTNLNAAKNAASNASKKIKNGTPNNEATSAVSSNTAAVTTSNGFSKASPSQMNSNISTLETNFLSYANKPNLEAAKTYKKPKLLEWCSTQLSMGDFFVCVRLISQKHRNAGKVK